MARPLRIQFPGAFYHVLSRGNERKVIFRTEADYKLFLKTLSECCLRFWVKVHAYCLMPNHFHFLLETQEGNLSQFMKCLLGVYTIRFNRCHRRSGHLFQGRYKAFLVEKESYLLELSRYIHLNPCRAGMATYPEEYPWSSMAFFLDGKAPVFFHKELILSEFSSPQAYRAFVLQGLTSKEDVLPKATGGLFLGSEPFVAHFRKKVEKAGRGISCHRQLLRLPGERLKELLRGETEEIQIYCWWKIGRRTQREIGSFFSKTDSAISHAIQRFEKKLDRQQALKKRIQQLEEVLSNFKN